MILMIHGTFRYITRIQHSAYQYAPILAIYLITHWCLVVISAEGQTYFPHLHLDLARLWCLRERGIYELHGLCYTRSCG